MKWVARIAGAAALLILAPAPANAQLIGKYRIRAGVGAQANPTFPGSKTLEVHPWPKLSVAKGDKPFGFGAHDDSFDLSLFSSNGFSAGPVAELRGRRDEEEVGAPVGDIDRAIELGGFAQLWLGESVRLRAEARKGVTGHSGVIGSLGADYVTRDGDKYLFSIGPRVRFADSQFVRTYYGISPAAAVASGLPAYDPGGGIHAVGASSTFNYSLGGRWGLFGYAEYLRLVGDARKSPIVTQLGSPDQLSVGAGVSYTFTIKL